MDKKVIKKNVRGKVDAQYNVEYSLVRNGKAIKLFSMNFIGNFFLKILRKFVINPIDEVSGQVKPGFKNHFAAYGLRIPFVTGNWTDNLVMKNLVVSAGKAGAASRINGAGSEAAFTYIALGTGTNAAAAGDTALQTEIADSGLSRANSTASRVTTTVTNDTAQLVNTFSVSGSKAITESGVLNAASTGTLLARQVFSAINVVNGDSLQITWKIAMS